MNELLAIAAFALAGTVSPGPNNSVLWVSGMVFGFHRTLPHVVGTALGMGALLLGVAAGIGALLDAVPMAETALKVAGSLYLLYLAVLVARSGGVGRAVVPRPLSVVQAAAFQWVNPKAWIFSITAVATFVPPTISRPLGVARLTGIIGVIVIGSSSIWAAGGAALGRLVDDDRIRRAIGMSLAVLLVASVALIWT